MDTDVDCEESEVFRMTVRFVWPEQPEKRRDHLLRGRRLGKEQEIRSMVSDIFNWRYIIDIQVEM